jgi:hypothetical protein
MGVELNIVTWLQVLVASDPGQSHTSRLQLFGTQTPNCEHSENVHDAKIAEARTS